MSKLKGLFKNLRGFFGVFIFVAIVYLIIRKIDVFGNILVVLLGFGAVVLVHEFGHFVVAKLSDIKVEAFSIFMPPTLLGVRKTEDGFRFRILPRLSAKDSGESSESRAMGDERQATRVGETEYRVGLIPFGGFVKMLGQDDVGPVKSSDDPRSFANKPVGTRIPVIAAGVIFNVISAVIIFMIIFLIGIKLMPPIAGAVVPDSPAARAGIKPGDEIIEIADKSKDLDFSNILVAAALSDEGEEVPLKVRHKDGSQEQIKLVAEYLPGQPLKDFGIYRPLSLTIAEVSNPNSFFEKTGLLPGDRITRVNGSDVQSYWQMEEIVQNTFAPKVAVQAQRADELVRTEIELRFRVAEGYEVKSESDLSHIYSVVPRLQITSVIEVPEIAAESLLSRIKNKFLAFFGKVNKRQKDTNKCSALRDGDIIVAINDVEYPTYKEMREVTEQYKDKKLKVVVLRKDANGVEEALPVIVVPKRPRGIERTLIGIEVALDFEHSVVAKTIAVEGGKPSLEIPRGATITAINGADVSSFYDVVREIRRHSGERITIDYNLNEETSGRANLDIGTHQELITIKSTFAESIPFKPLEITYQASGPIDAITMGYRRTVMFIAQTYVTLKRLIGWVVSPKHLMGPVGIIAFSYRVVAERPLIEYIYFLGLINAVIAVFNLLPLPPLDGGLIALLLVEKIKGSALSERTCQVIAYAGWVLIGTLLIYVTFNDIARILLAK